jgi:hypothetical protein
MNLRLEKALLQAAEELGIPLADRVHAKDLDRKYAHLARLKNGMSNRDRLLYSLCWSDEKADWFNEGVPEIARNSKVRGVKIRYSFDYSKQAWWQKIQRPSLTRPHSEMIVMMTRDYSMGIELEIRSDDTYHLHFFRDQEREPGIIDSFMAQAYLRIAKIIKGQYYEEQGRRAVIELLRVA